MGTKIQAIIDFVYQGAGVNQATSALGKLSQTGKDIGQAWGAIATPIQSTIQIFQQVGQAAKQAYEFISEGTQLSLAQDKFDALSKSIGTTADALLGELKTATRGTISDANLMASATSIMSLGLADTSEETVRLASLVGKLGWDMNQVTLTLANQSTMRLDSLGLSVSDVTDRVDALKAAGYSADQAFKFAILEAGEEKVKLLGDAADTTAGKLKILEANAANLKDNFQATFSETFITRLNDFSGGLFETAEGASAAGKSFGELVADAIAFGLHMRTAADVVQDLTGEFENGTVATRQNKTAMSEQRAATIAATAATDGWMASLNTVTTMTPQATQAIIDNATALYQTTDAYAEFQDKLVQTDAHLTENEAMVATANARMVEWGETIPTVTGYIAKSAEAMDAFAASTGQYFMAAANAEGTTLDVNQALVESIAAAGGSAEEIGAAALALGTMSEAQVEAAMKAAELEIRIAGVRQAYLDGRISADDLTTAIGQQIDIVNGMDVSVNTATGSVGLFGDAMTTSADSTQRMLDKIGLFPDEVSTTVNIDTSEAQARIDALLGKLNELGGSRPGEEEEMRGLPPASTGGSGNTSTGGNTHGNIPQYASGADFIVPPGYPNDSYPMRVQSGERVQVTPAGQSSGGNTYNLYVTAMDGGANVSREFNYMKAISNV